MSLTPKILSDGQVRKIKAKTQIVANLKGTLLAHRTRQKDLERAVASLQRPRVIAVIDSAGWLELYGTQGMAAKVIELPETSLCAESEAYKEIELAKMMKRGDYALRETGCARGMTWGKLLESKLLIKQIQIYERIGEKV